MTRFFVRTFVIAITALTLSSTASAQPQIQLVGGMTDAAARNLLLGGAIGVRIGFFEIDGEVGRMRDALPRGVLDRLNDLQRERGLPVTALVSMPTTYGLASVRFISPSGPLRPFVSGGFGVARVEPRLNVTVYNIPLGDIFGVTSFGPYNQPLGTLGVGARVDVGKANVEVGYRYMRILTDFRLPANLGTGRIRTDLNTVYAGLGVRFW